MNQGPGRLVQCGPGRPRNRTPGVTATAPAPTRITDLTGFDPTTVCTATHVPCPLIRIDASTRFSGARLLFFRRTPAGNSPA